MALSVHDRTTSRRRYFDYLSRRRLELKSGADSDPKSPRKQLRDGRGFGRLVAEFWKLLEGYRAGIAWALLALSVARLLSLTLPASTKFVIDYVLLKQPIPEGIMRWVWMPTSPQGKLIFLAAVVMVVSVVSTLIGLWARWRATLTTQRLQVATRRRLFDHAARLPLHKVHDIKSGGVSSLLREDAGGVGDLVFNLVFNPWRAVIQLLGGLAVLVWVDYRLLLGSLAVLPIVYWNHRLWVRWIRPLYRDIKKQRQDIDAQTTESFAGMRVVRAFGRQRREAARFVGESHLMSRQEINVWWTARLIEVIWDLLLPLASGILLLYGGTQVLAGRLSPGDLMMFLIYLTMLLEPIAILATSATQFQSNLAALDRVLDVLGEPKELSDRPSSRPATEDLFDGPLRFEQVKFRYPRAESVALRENEAAKKTRAEPVPPGDKAESVASRGKAAPVPSRGKAEAVPPGDKVESVVPGGKGESFALKNINVTIEPGELIALVGRSGSGKTTFCNLVARFYDPTEGRITIDGVDLRDVHVETYRKYLGIVEQDVFLFDGTVAENIAYAIREAEMSEVERAARIANAHQFIEALPLQYQTRIGERGVRLSGGQRQRIAIARAVLADPKIFILDEATSNLDTESERLIQQSLAELMKGRTSIVIAHRLSTIRDADRIFVMDQGEIIETGTHAELMTAGTRYREMVDLQQMDLVSEAS